MSLHRLAACLGLCASVSLAQGAPDNHVAPTAYRSVADIVQAAPASDWRTPAPENTLYLDLPAGRVIIELAPRFAPAHVADLRTLLHQHYFDGLAILRAQDNYVVQWGDPDEVKPRSIGDAHAQLAAEFDRSSKEIAFDVLAEADVYAPEVGFVEGFPAARDPANSRLWPVHCYGMVGAGRDNDANSGNATQLYAVIGHAPRQLDRNVTLLGRVLKGMEWLAALPRGPGAMGFYDQPSQRTPISAARLAADLPAAQRESIQVMRTDSASFRQVIEAKRNRRDPWTKMPAGHIDVCNVPIPVR
jgi:peptidylprolyl isomerase